MQEVLLLNSGGLDSACIAAKLFKDGFSVHSLFIDFGAAPSTASGIAAAETATRYCVDHHVITVDLGITLGTPMNGASGVIPHPILTTLSLGCLYGRAVNLFEVYSGALYGAIDDVYASRYNEIAVGAVSEKIRAQAITPLATFMTHKQAADWAGLGPTDLSYTHSCGVSSTPCGTCGSCVSRDGFMNQKIVEDPIDELPTG